MHTIHATPSPSPQVGDKFALNVLEEGKYQPTLKHFLTRFPAGADRFEGVEVRGGAGMAGGWGSHG